MGRIIIKATPDRDLYVDWSTVVGAPAFIGDRAAMLDYLRRDRQQDPASSPEIRLARADASGTSAAGDYGWFGAWNDTRLTFEQRGAVPRAKLAEFLEAYARRDRAAFLALVEPFEDVDSGSTDKQEAHRG